jgi:hypothetical protein
MNEQEFSRALRDLIRQHAAELDSGGRAGPIGGGGKWHVRLLTSLSILFWILGIAGLILLVLALDRLVLSLRTANIPGFNGAEMLRGTTLLHHSIPIIFASVAALLLGAVFTLLLVLSSRRATLRHINTKLATLTQQINELRERAEAQDTQIPSHAFHTREV